MTTPNRSPETQSLQTVSGRDEALHSEEQAQQHFRILLASNCGVARTVIIGQLLARGYDVIEAETEEKALQFTQTVEPDLILLDAYLGDISGLALLKKIKSMEETVDVPVIFLGNKIECQKMIDALGTGAADYIIKPIDPRESIARINTQLKIRKLTQEKKQPNANL